MVPVVIQRVPAVGSGPGDMVLALMFHLGLSAKNLIFSFIPKSVCTSLWLLLTVCGLWLGVVVRGCVVLWLYVDVWCAQGVHSRCVCTWDAGCAVCMHMGCAGCISTRCAKGMRRMSVRGADVHTATHGHTATDCHRPGLRMLSFSAFFMIGALACNLCAQGICMLVWVFV